MRKQFGIKVTETMEEEVEEMSHICMYYEQEGKKAGLAEGMLIGERRGKKSVVLCQDFGQLKYKNFQFLV
ncbi:hypothetical protein [Amedibacillus dolichus]|uniref:hypothetical protein n=1 Tax=Amedibacillus dolichus TaxID=31971 RepID=UPI0003040AB7|nr:hypothetical protein [Amedibacillus dolichus]